MASSYLQSVKIGLITLHRYFNLYIFNNTRLKIITRSAGHSRPHPHRPDPPPQTSPPADLTPCRPYPLRSHPPQTSPHRLYSRRPYPQQTSPHHGHKISVCCFKANMGALACADWEWHSCCFNMSFTWSNGNSNESTVQCMCISPH